MFRSFLFVSLFISTAGAQQPQVPQRRQPPAGYPNRPPAAIDPLTAPTRPTVAPPIDLSGSWRGVYWAEDTIILADLVLTTDAAKRTVTGDLHYTTVPGPLLRGAKALEGNSKISGVVDPGALTLLLEAAGDIRPPTGMFAKPPGAKGVRLCGIYSATRNEIAGQVVSSFGSRDKPYFLFARAEGAAKIKPLAEHAAKAQGPQTASGSPPSDEALAKWAARYGQEYDDNKLGGGVAGTSARALPLLNDANFKPVFGESYDTIELGKLAAAMRRAGAAVGAGSLGRLNSPDAKFVREHGNIQYMLWPSEAKIVSVAATRAIDAWEAELIKRFQSDPPVASAFDDLAAAQAAIKERVTYAWPSDTSATEAALEQSKSRLGGSTLTANVERAISGASGLAGAKALASWAKDNAEMLKACTDTERAGAQQRIDAGLDAILDQLLAEPLKQVASFDTGAQAGSAGAAWYTSLIAQFGFAAERPPVRHAIERLMARRDQDLAASRDQLSTRIAACKTVPEVDAIFQADLSIPGDSSLPSYAALAEVASKHKQQIQYDFMMSLFATDEKEYMDRPGHIDVKKGAGKAPSKEAIRLAFVRGMAGGTAGMIDDHTARYVSRELIIPFPLNVRFSEEELLDFAPIPDSPDFECRIKILIQMTLPQDNLLSQYSPNVRKGVEDMVTLANTLGRAAASESQKEVLHLYEDGWGIPRLRASGGAAAAIDAMLKPR